MLQVITSGKLRSFFRHQEQLSGRQYGSRWRWFFCNLFPPSTTKGTFATFANVLSDVVYSVFFFLGFQDCGGFTRLVFPPTHIFFFKTRINRLVFTWLFLHFDKSYAIRSWGYTSNTVSFYVHEKCLSCKHEVEVTGRREESNWH